MTCRLRRYGYRNLDIKQDSVELNPEEYSFEEYTCDQVRELKEQWKKEFREKNGTDKILAAKGWNEDHKPRDRMYDNYCQSIEDFLSQCKCKKE